MTKSPVLNLFDDEVCVCANCLNVQADPGDAPAAQPPEKQSLETIKESILAMQWLLVGLQNEEVPHAFLNEERLDGYSPAQMAKLEEEWLAAERSVISFGG